MPPRSRASPKVFVGYSDITAVHTWLQQRCGLVSFHGPMLEGRFADRARYDRDSFVRAVSVTEPMGALVPPGLEIWREGEASGVLVGGTITQLAASLGTPFAFDPPPGCVLFFDEVNERPYRLDRLLTQLVQAGIIGRAGGHRVQRAAGLRRAGWGGARRGRRPPRARRLRRPDARGLSRRDTRRARR